jgi:hypothetical protein
MQPKKRVDATERLSGDGSHDRIRCGEVFVMRITPYGTASNRKNRFVEVQHQQSDEDGSGGGLSVDCDGFEGVAIKNIEHSDVYSLDVDDNRDGLCLSLTTRAGLWTIKVKMIGGISALIVHDENEEKEYSPILLH